MDIEKYLQSGKLEQYVLGLSSSEERKEVEKLAKEFPEIDAYICDLHGCMNTCSESNNIPASKEPEHKSKCKTFHLKTKASNLVVERRSDTAFNKISYVPWITVIASLLILGLFALTLFLYQSYEAAKNEAALLSTQLHHLKLDNVSLEEDNQKMMQQSAVLKDKKTRLISLRGSDIAPNTHGIVYWNKDLRKAYLSICSLPKTPEGHQCFVWANINGNHQKVGVLNTNDTELLHSLSFTKECNGFCITFEKDSANASPSIDKMLVKGDM